MIHLQLLVAGGDLEGPNADVLLATRGRSGTPPAILRLQDLGLAPLDQVVDQSPDEKRQ